MNGLTRGRDAFCFLGPVQCRTRKDRESTILAFVQLSALIAITSPPFVRGAFQKEIS